MTWKDFEERVVQLYTSRRACLHCSPPFDSCEPGGTEFDAPPRHFDRQLWLKLNIEFARLMQEANLSPLDISNAVKSKISLNPCAASAPFFEEKTEFFEFPTEQEAREFGDCHPFTWVDQDMGIRNNGQWFVAQHFPLVSWNPVLGHCGVTHGHCISVDRFLESLRTTFLEKQSSPVEQQKLVDSSSGFKHVWSKIRDIGCSDYDLMLRLLRVNADKPSGTDLRLMKEFNECFTFTCEAQPVPLSLMYSVALERVKKEGEAKNLEDLVSYSRLLFYYDVPEFFGVEEAFANDYEEIGDAKFGDQIDWYGEEMIVVEPDDDRLDHPSLLPAALVFNDLGETNPFSLQISRLDDYGEITGDTLLG